MTELATPGLGLNSFICPDCGAFSSQEWFVCYATRPSHSLAPINPSANEFKIAAIDLLQARNAERNRWAKRNQGYVWLASNDSLKADSNYLTRVGNLAMSQCYACKEFAIWLNDHCVFPIRAVGLTPNGDMPADVTADFREAAAIVDLSPRGAAALLRLCVQKLCRELGEKGENINDDIGCLVKKGLSKKVQQALDYVRVVGNEAVHPGQIDLKDDQEAAYMLFQLVNLIVEAMISQPKHVEAAYMRLPESKRAAIDKRDAGKS